MTSLGACVIVCLCYILRSAALPAFHKASPGKKGVFANINQYSAGGLAACLHIAASCASYHLKNPEESLYDPDLLDRFCKTGAQNHPSNQADEIMNIFDNPGNQRCYQLALVPETPLWNENARVPGPVKSSQEMQQDIDGAALYSSSTALLANGIETWVLIKEDNGTHSVFDSHGRTDLYTRPNAYIRNFPNITALWEYINKYNNAENKDVLHQDLNAQERSGIYCYWTKPREGANL